MTFEQLKLVAVKMCQCELGDRRICLTAQLLIVRSGGHSDQPAAVPAAQINHLPYAGLEPDCYIRGLAQIRTKFR